MRDERDYEDASPRRRESGLNRALEDLEKGLAVLREALDVLFDQLERVTQPAQDTVQAVAYRGSDEPADRPVSPLVAQIRAFTHHVELSTSRLRDVMSRLDT